jgi:hypothetical protein
LVFSSPAFWQANHARPSLAFTSRARFLWDGTAKDSDFDLPGSREGQRVVIRPLAGARGYRKVQSSKDVGLKSLAKNAQKNYHLLSDIPSGNHRILSGNFTG